MLQLVELLVNNSFLFSKIKVQREMWSNIKKNLIILNLLSDKWDVSSNNGIPSMKQWLHGQAQDYGT